jgi:hypothetical protein
LIEMSAEASPAGTRGTVRAHAGDGAMKSQIVVVDRAVPNAGPTGSWVMFVAEDKYYASDAGSAVAGPKGEQAAGPMRQDPRLALALVSRTPWRVGAHVWGLI